MVIVPLRHRRSVFLFHEKLKIAPLFQVQMQKKKKKKKAFPKIYGWEQWQHTGASSKQKNNYQVKQQWYMSSNYQIQLFTSNAMRL